MGFEYIYAWLENLEWFFVTGTILSVLALIALIIGRISNEIDADDWRLMMFFTIPVLFLFILFDLSPSMEHIQKVRTTVVKPYVEPIIKTEGEEPNEKSTVYYPNAACINSLVCGKN